MSDSRLKLVTIMNYPPDTHTRRMCHVFLTTAIANGAKSVTILYEDHKPVIARAHRRAADIDVVRAKSHDVGHPHFNLRFKLPNLAALPFPFLFLDADTAVLSDLTPLWERRHDKPWVGVDHQWVPSDARTHRPPFLNSGLQLVGDPAFYDLNAILDVQTAAAPLARAADFTKEQMFACPGADQAVLFRYFRTIGYDYTHSAVGPAWNSCAGVTDITRAGDRWVGRTRGLHPDHDVHVVHYWSQFKPWAIGCPVYAAGG